MDSKERLIRGEEISWSEVTIEDLKDLENQWYDLECDGDSKTVKATPTERSMSPFGLILFRLFGGDV